ncbi:hypothetical protein Micbo1qcDRAFT_217782 [Microdochium bolleyi]|uniref:F-box domain-containing protein n=1 Tax=Microdochium bolleyi TaxID=196109 RepID=A0A136JFY2_9PEZI|nr:hypothetical protein Micbo1qcDRAFT_217782 [Microdochium bolleyi]
MLQKKKKKKQSRKRRPTNPLGVSLGLYAISRGLNICRRLHGPACLAKFAIPESLIVGSQTSEANQAAALTRLPLELLIMIIGDVDPISQACLAVSCKGMLQIVHSAIGLPEIPSAIKHRGVQPDSCPAVRLLLELMWPGAYHSGYAVRDNRVGICTGCMGYRSTRLEDYQGEFTDKLIEEGSEPTKVQSIIVDWCDGENVECPSCFCKWLSLFV